MRKGKAEKEQQKTNICGALLSFILCGYGRCSITTEALNSFSRLFVLPSQSLDWRAIK